MFKIFSCKRILEEGMPYIITAVTRDRQIDYLDGFVLINRLSPKLEPVLLLQRSNLNYVVPTQSLGEDFKESQVLKMQFSWSKNQLAAWLYEQRKGVHISEQNLEWEELEPKDLIVPLAVMFASDKRIHAKALSIRDATSCKELVDFFSMILDFKLKIEKIDEGEK